MRRWRQRWRWQGRLRHRADTIDPGAGPLGRLARDGDGAGRRGRASWRCRRRRARPRWARRRWPGFPTSGADYALLTTGDAAIAGDAGHSESSGKDLGGTPVRGDTDFDVTVIEIDLNVPANTNCLVGMDFRFLSEEFSEYVNSAVQRRVHRRDRQLDVDDVRLDDQRAGQLRLRPRRQPDLDQRRRRDEHEGGVRGGHHLRRRDADPQRRHADLAGRPQALPVDLRPGRPRLRLGRDGRQRALRPRRRRRARLPPGRRARRRQQPRHAGRLVLVGLRQRRLRRRHARRGRQRLPALLARVRPARRRGARPRAVQPRLPGRGHEGLLRARATRPGASRRSSTSSIPRPGW